MATDFRRKEELPELTRRIVETYRTIGKIHHLEHCPLPSLDVIVGVLEHLKDVLYPGYRRREGLHFGNIEYHVGDCIDQLHDQLTEQIGRALRHNAQVDCDAKDQDDYDAKGQAIAIEVLNCIPDLRSVLVTDVQAAFEGDPSCQNIDEVIFCYPGLEAMTVHRIAHELHKLDVPFIPRMMAEWAHQQTGIDIHPGAKIGTHFFIDHGTGVVIGETCEIGQGVKIYQGVTLGALSFRTDAVGALVRGEKRHPTIEDRVVLYANATILGGNTIIGHDSVIGSNVWLTKTVDPFTTVTMEKPKLRIRSEDPSEIMYQI
jgi:serine O-acetyltransferase